MLARCSISRGSMHLGDPPYCRAYKSENSISHAQKNKGLRVPQFRKESCISATPRRVFANGHGYHINSISLNRYVMRWRWCMLHFVRYTIFYTLYACTDVCYICRLHYIWHVIRTDVCYIVRLHFGDRRYVSRLHGGDINHVVYAMSLVIMSWLLNATSTLLRHILHQHFLPRHDTLEHTTSAFSSKTWHSRTHYISIFFQDMTL